MQVSAAGESEPASTRVQIAGLALMSGLVAMGLTLAWFHGHLGFSSYDDEGYVMMSVRAFLDGNRLYDEVYTQYGPFYYLSHAPYYSQAALGLSHDSVRLETIVFWAATGAACAVVALRSGGETAGAAVAFALAMVALQTCAKEAGHPQGLCGLLIVLALLTSTFIAPGRRVAVVLLGLLVAALSMTKINLGVFVGAAVLLPVLASGRGIGLPRPRPTSWQPAYSPYQWS